MSGYFPRLCFKLLSPYTETKTQTKEVQNFCPHMMAAMMSDYKYCSECGQKTTKTETVSTRTFKDGFSTNDCECTVMYKGKYKLEKDDNNFFYINLSYDNNNIQSIKAAIQELETIEQEMKNLGINGIGGFISPHFD